MPESILAWPQRIPVSLKLWSGDESEVMADVKMFKITSLVISSEGTIVWKGGISVESVPKHATSWETLGIPHGPLPWEGTCTSPSIGCDIAATYRFEIKNTEVQYLRPWTAAQEPYLGPGRFHWLENDSRPEGLISNHLIRLKLVVDEDVMHFLTRAAPSER